MSLQNDDRFKIFKKHFRFAAAQEVRVLIQAEFKFTDGGVRGGGGSVRVRVVEDSATHTLDQWEAGQEGGLLSVAIETGGQWCWILLLGRRGCL